MHSLAAMIAFSARLSGIWVSSVLRETSIAKSSFLKLPEHLSQKSAAD